jgi:hypothetical protein
MDPTDAPSATSVALKITVFSIFIPASDAHVFAGF